MYMYIINGVRFIVNEFVVNGDHCIYVCAIQLLYTRYISIVARGMNGVEM